MSESRNIAIIGGSGTMGSHILSSLLAKPTKHTITVLTRESSTSTFPSGVTVKNVDYTSLSSITSALIGIEFLIITLTATAPPDTHPRIVTAAAAAGVKYIMPNYFGFGLGERKGKVVDDDKILGGFEKFVNDVRDTEGVHFIALACGFWYEWSLGMPWYGFSIAERKVVMNDRGLKRINTSTWGLCGDTVAAILNGNWNDWKDEAVHVSSFLVSQRDMLESLHRVLGTTDEDWEIEYQDVMERYEEGMKELAEGNRMGFAKAMYAKAFYPEGRGDYETGWGLDNGKLGLSEEELDEATRRTVKLVEKGFGVESWRETGRITRLE